MRSCCVSRRAKAMTSSRVRPGSAPRSGSPPSSQLSSANQSRPTYSMPSNAMRQDTLKRRPSYSSDAMCGCTISSATERLPEAVGGVASLAQEREQWRKELGGLLDVRHVPAVMQDDALRPEGTRRRLRGRQRDGVFASVNDERRQPDGLERGEYVVCTERLPDGLLDAARHPEGGEVARAPRIGEVAGDAQLEGPLSERFGVAL